MIFSRFQPIRLFFFWEISHFRKKKRIEIPVSQAFESQKCYEDMSIQAERVGFGMICFTVHEIQICEIYLQNIFVIQMYGTEVV